MKLEKALCPHCGAPIRIIPGKRVMNCEYCDMQIIVSDLDLDEEDAPQEDFRNFEEPESSSGFRGSDVFKEHGSSFSGYGPNFTDFSGGDDGGYDQSRNIPYDETSDPDLVQHGYWTPVGFRSHRIRNMILAGLFYFSLLSGIFGGGSDFFLNLCTGICLFFAISVAFLWKPLVDRLPGLKKDMVSGKKTMRIIYILGAFMVYSLISQV